MPFRIHTAVRWERLFLPLLLIATFVPFTSGNSITSRPLEEHAINSDDNQSNSTTSFQLLDPQKTGIDFVHPIDTRHPMKYLYVGGFASAGVAIGDVNNDGRQDVFLSGGPVTNRLYLQVGSANSAESFRFRDVTEQAGVDGGDTWGSGTTMVDIDNDGDLDIYVCKYDSPNELFINETGDDGSIRFVESAREYGLDLVDACLTSAFCDYDLDGDLDVFIAAYQYVDPAGRPEVPPVIERDGRYFVKPAFDKYYGIVRGVNGRPTFTNIGRRDYLLESNAANEPKHGIRFTNVTECRHSRLRSRQLGRLVGLQPRRIARLVHRKRFQGSGSAVSK